MACIAFVVGRAPAAQGQEAQAEVLTLEHAAALALGENRQVKARPSRSRNIPTSSRPCAREGCRSSSSRLWRRNC
jgi:hypothetical protein